MTQEQQRSVTMCTECAVLNPLSAALNPGCKAAVTSFVDKGPQVKQHGCIHSYGEKGCVQGYQG